MVKLWGETKNFVLRMKDNHNLVIIMPVEVNKFETFNYLNVAFISYKLTMWN